MKKDYGIAIELILWTKEPSVDINKIVSLIGLEPFEIESIGDTIEYGRENKHTRIAQVSSVIYRTNKIKTEEVESAIDSFMNQIKPKKDVIVKTVKENNLNARVCVWIDLENKPLISLPKPFVKYASDLESDIEFDMYISGSD
ncbi:MAG: DUF4279 domain-containing protein [Clostridia bacterium]|nr:DUF4279 domain-containing protein [Clostridia bacterium]